MTFRDFAVGLCVLLCPLPGTSLASDLLPAVMVASCFSCHGKGGTSPGAIPSISGLDAETLEAKLAAFVKGSTDATIMTRIARGYDAAELSAIVTYLANRN